MRHQIAHHGGDCLRAIRPVGGFRPNSTLHHTQHTFMYLLQVDDGAAGSQELQGGNTGRHVQVSGWLAGACGWECGVVPSLLPLSALLHDPAGREGLCLCCVLLSVCCVCEAPVCVSCCPVPPGLVTGL